MAKRIILVNITGISNLLLKKVEILLHCPVDVHSSPVVVALFAIVLAAIIQAGVNACAWTVFTLGLVVHLNALIITPSIARCYPDLE